MQYINGYILSISIKLSKGAPAIMQKLLKNRKSSGFTIIEVLIVLAIAGLIMVVVFLAVPALQRQGRNNALNTNANNIFTGVNNFVSNNNGTLPTGVALASNVVTITGPAGSNSETVRVDNGVASVLLQTSAASPATAAPGNVVIVTGTNAKCNTTASGLVSGGSTRGVAVAYSAESGNGNIVRCLN